MNKVAIGMSGGVDSAVAAYLLKKKGYEVVGVNISLGENEAGDARKAAAELDIPFYVIDLKKEFKEYVIDYFIDEYMHGRTPNPCTVCNRQVKWEALLLESGCVDADYIATGHYAGVVKLENGRYTLRRCAFIEKDQTYALYRLTQEQLKRTVMPLGKYGKDEVRSIAESIGLHVAGKPDSQDICFIPGGDYASFIDKNVKVKPAPGNFVAADGTILGRHKGITRYTVGQRKGLGLALGYPAFVLEIRPDTNEVVIGTRQESMSMTFKANRLNFMSVPDLQEPMHLFVKIRYNHKGAWCRAEKIGADEVLCTFDEPQYAVTPGQSAVFYDGEYVVGGGVIKSN